MSVFRVAANANELNEFVGTALGGSGMPIAPYFQSFMRVTRADNILAVNDFEENDLWLTFYASRQSSTGASGGRYAVALYDTDISEVLPLFGIIKATTNDHITVRRKSGSSMVDMGTIQMAHSTLYRFDIHFRAHASNGRIAVYVNNDLALEYVGDTDGAARVNRAEFRRLAQTTSNTNTETCYSAIAFSTSDTRAVTLVERRPVAVGAFDEWAGPVENVIPSNNPITTYIEASAPNRRKSFSYTTPAEIADREITGIILSSVQREGVGGMAPTAPFFRTSAGDIRDGPPVSTGVAFAPVQQVLANNGGSPWTYEAIASGQIGVLSSE